MPNWCANNITLSHKDPKMIERAHKAFNDGTLLDEFIPIPAELKDVIVNGTVHEELVEKTGYNDWYEFCVQEWGTKWDISPYGAEVSDDGLTLEGGFDTAWAPPIAAYNKLKEMGFTISASYYEPGCCFIGEWIDGVDDCYETPNTLDEYENIPEHLAEAYGIGEYLSEMEEQEE